MAVSPFHSRQFMIPFCIGWFVWISVHQLALYYLGVDWFTALTDSIVTNTLLLFISILLFTIFRFYLPRVHGFLNIFIWVVVLTIAWFFSCNYLLQWFLNDESYNQLLKTSWPLRVAIGFLVNGIMSMIAYAYYNWQEKSETEKQRTEVMQLNREAELFRLREQLQPHFLFNALNSINALIGSSPQQARTMIYQLSDFLRNSLRKEQHSLIPLKDELQTLGLYLDIEKVRFGNRLSASIHSDENCTESLLPPLLLQPLVENAIKFGLYDTTDEIVIQLNASLRNNELMISIQNPFDAETSSPKKGTGFGLNSVQRRLFLLYGRNDLLKTEISGTVFKTTVTIPQQPI
jgi:sensor histidine kinase YesM